MRFLTVITFTIFFITSILAQNNTPMRVLHGTAVPQDMAVLNLHIDDDSQKYIGGKHQIYQLFSADNATPLNTEDNHWHLMQQNDGNANRSFPLELIETILNPDTLAEKPTVNAAFFDDKTNTLWIGTDKTGLFQLLVSVDNAQLVQQYTVGNSKLKSNTINAILVDKYNRTWAGSDQGILMREGNDDEFKLFEKREKILDITALGPDVWILGKGILWRADERNRWIPGDVDPKLYQGSVRDIQYDSEGRLWVASDIITRYDVEKDIVEKFDRSNGFTSNQVSAIRVDRQDALWVGTLDKGIFLIEPQAKITLSLKIAQQTACDNTTNGVIESKVIGGTAPYRYKWSNGKTTQHIDRLGMGLYALTLTDATGQTKTAEANMTPPTITATFTEHQPASREETTDGQATLDISGGQAPYTVQWDNDETGRSAVRLSPGKHAAVITDANNCKGIAQVEVTMLPPPEVPAEESVATTAPNGKGKSQFDPAATEAEIAPPADKPEVLTPLTVHLTYQSILDCPSDQTTAQAATSGGKPPYAYQWSANGATTEKITNIGSGNHTLTVTDAVGNTSVQAFDIQAPTPLQAIASVVEPASDDRSRNGKAKVGVNGGTGKIAIAWDNGETATTAQKLTFGPHTVTVTDEKGCTATTTLNMDKKIIAALDARKLLKGQTIRIDQLYFDADSTDVKPTSIPVLNEIFTFLQANPDIKVEIGGHTNNIPAHDFCDNLSTARAKSVVDFLVGKGIPSEQITYKGYGKRKPVATNKTPAGRKKNQRVEIKVMDIKGG